MLVVRFMSFSSVLLRLKSSKENRGKSSWGMDWYLLLIYTDTQITILLKYFKMIKEPWKQLNMRLEFASLIHFTEWLFNRKIKRIIQNQSKIILIFMYIVLNIKRIMAWISRKILFLLVSFDFNWKLRIDQDLVKNNVLTAIELDPPPTPLNPCNALLDEILMLHEENRLWN